jgi:tetratricopeptide (TPR) repeat protein
MRKAVCTTVMFILSVVGLALCEAKSLDEYIQEAGNQNQEGYLRQAIQTMEKAVVEHPQSPEAHSYLGLYAGMRAGQTQDMTEAMNLVNKAFEELDKAVSLDPQSNLVRFHRGLMGVSVPEFFGRLDQGIADLEFVIDEYQKSPQSAPRDQLVRAYDLLAQGYRTRGDLDQAREAYEHIIDLAPGSEMAEKAEAGINDLAREEKTESIQSSAEQQESADVQALQEKIPRDPQNPALFVELGHAYLQAQSYEKAREAFRKALDLDGTLIAAYKGLARSIMEEVAQGYDQRIHENASLRTNLAFELVKTLDQAVAAAPNDMELRLWRGITDVQMPFFVQKLDQGIGDLERIANSDLSDSLKAEALFWLGKGYEKKATTAWIRVVKEYDDSPAARRVFAQMNPQVNRPQIADLRKPLVTIEFVVGFRDELAPQTAVWIETGDGQFVKTIYVSGFAGNVRERQVTLPIWGDVSNFVDADAITGASVDVGHHVFVWDLQDRQGNQVKKGDYSIKVEVSYWPSMFYQLAEADITVGNKQTHTVVEEDDFIPYLEVTYYPEK